MAAITAEQAKKMETEDLLRKKTDLEHQIARYNNIQLAKKVQLNSAYGAFGNPYFRYYDVRIAGSVTRAGQFLTRAIGEEINKYFNKILNTGEEDYVVFSHTDSMYIRLDGVVRHYFPEGHKDPLVIARKVEEVCVKKIYPKIEKIFEKIAGYINAFENRMKMKIEAIADKGIWTGKNRYVLRLRYFEGTFYRHPITKKVGLETQKSNIPAVCRKKIGDAIDLVLDGNITGLRTFVNGFREEYDGLPFQDIALPIGVKRFEKFMDQKTLYTKRTPKHVKGAILYNKALVDFKLEKNYQTIKEGDKIKFLSLTVPNPINDKVIAFLDVLPPELELDSYIDRDSMFKISFLNPIQKVIDAAGWDLKEKISIESVFGW